MYQKLIIVGRLGRDPEQRFTPTGQAVTSFPVATDRQYTDQGGQPVKETVWFRVTAWGKLAETCGAHLVKGKLVLVEGRFNVSAYIDKEQKPAGRLELTANTVKFLSAKEGDAFRVEPEEMPF
jgi:single-strand DNA-binding protein